MKKWSKISTFSSKNDGNLEAIASPMAGAGEDSWNSGKPWVQAEDWRSARSSLCGNSMVFGPAEKKTIQTKLV